MILVTFIANSPRNLLPQEVSAWHSLCKNGNVYNKSTTTLVTEGVTSSFTHRWLGSVTVRVSDLRPSGREFDSRSGRYQVTTLGKLFTPMCL